MRALREIAQEIKRDWQKPYFGAVPYLNAMTTLENMDSQFYEDDAHSIVAYFLANAATWRGDTARRVKAELNSILKR